MTNKEQEKRIKAIIRAMAKERHYKVRDYAKFTAEGEYFIHCDNFIDKEKLKYRINVKFYEYDNIFWNIMNMPSNCKEPDSLRAVGAFTSPSIKVADGELEITDNYDEL